jgi:hypothetical protein
MSDPTLCLDSTARHSKRSTSKARLGSALAAHPCSARSILVRHDRPVHVEYTKELYANSQARASQQNPRIAWEMTHRTLSFPKNSEKAPCWV